MIPGLRAAVGTAVLAWAIGPLALAAPAPEADFQALALPAAQAQTWQAAQVRAETVPAQSATDVRALGAWLGAGSDTPTERLRAVFRWVTDNIDYDVAAFYKGEKGALDPAEVLHLRRAACDGYARLFSALAQAAGVPEVLVVAGYVKDPLHRDGQAFSRPNHAWNAVRLADGRWVLIDPTWGAGYLDGRSFRKQFDPSFFMLAPQVLAHSHLAAQPDQHFGAQPRSADEFARAPYVPHTLIGAINPRLLAQIHSSANIPATFDHPSGAFEVQDAPMRAQLKAGQPVQLRVASSHYAELALFNPPDWAIQPTQAPANSWTISPRAGRLVLLGRSADSPTFSYLVAWEVLP